MSLQYYQDFLLIVLNRIKIEIKEKLCTKFIGIFTLRANQSHPVNFVVAHSR